MKNSITVKFIAVFLASVFLLGVVLSGAAIVTLIGLDLYNSSPQEELENQMYAERQNLAVNLAYTYATLELGSIPEEYYRQYYGYDWKNTDLKEGYYYYAIYNDQGIMVQSTMPSSVAEEHIYEIELRNIGYRSFAPLGDGENRDSYFDEADNRYVDITYDVLHINNYTVQLYVEEDAYFQDAPWQLVKSLYEVRYRLFIVLGLSLLLLSITVVYLCCIAGHSSSREDIRPGGLNRLPLDGYTLAVGFGLFLLLQLAVFLVEELAEDMTALMTMPPLGYSTYHPTEAPADTLFGGAYDID